MTQRRLLLALAWCLLGLSLISGYHAIGNLIGLLISGLNLLAWLLYWWLSRRAAASEFVSGLPPVCLFVSVGLAVSGLLLGAPAFLMIAAAGLSLAVWDLLALDVALSDRILEEQGRRYEMRHLRSLGVALSSGLLLSCGVRLVSFGISFVVLLLLVACVIFSLDRLWAALDAEHK